MRVRITLAMVWNRATRPVRLYVFKDVRYPLFSANLAKKAND